MYIYTQAEFHMEQCSAPRVLRLKENSSFSVKIYIKNITLGKRMKQERIY